MRRTDHYIHDAPMPSQQILEYSDATESRDTRDDLKLGIAHAEGPRVAIDCGCGAGSDAATSALSDVAGELALRSSREIVVAGHTDNVGSEPDNLLLAKNRAEAVAKYLGTEPGLEGIDVATQSFGETRPIATNETEEGRQRNRRVEITVLADTEPTADVQPMQIIGIWDSSEGLMQLSASGNDVAGEYGDGDGKITGVFSQPDEFNGYWFQRSSSQACATEKDGSRYWGRIQPAFCSTSIRSTF